jgi:hypothetical protein
VLVRMTETRDRLETVRISNDPQLLREVITRAGEAPEVVPEATYGWYWPRTPWPGWAHRCIWRTRWG